MFNIVLILLSLAAVTLPFIDTVVMRDVHKKKLQQRFEVWWKQVEHQNKLDVALACASIADKFLNYIFGPILLFSKKLWLRCFLFSSSLLIATLATLGVLQNQPVAITPWSSYTTSVSIVTNSIDVLFSKATLDYFKQIDMANVSPFYKNTNAYILTYNSNYYVLDLNTNAIKRITPITPFGHGHIYFNYERVFSGADQSSDTNSVAKTKSINEVIDEMTKGAMRIREFTIKHSAHNDVVLYSVIYFVGLSLLNTISFILSQAMCRRMLKEIVKARTTAATASLIITNLTAVCFLSVIAVAFFVMLAIPIFWFFIPFVHGWFQESIYTALLYCIFGSIDLWLLSSTSAKIIVLIAFVPSLFASGVGLFSLLAIRCKGQFHFIVKEILLRCAERNPIAVLLATFLFITGVLTVLAKCLHLTAFL